MKHKSFGCWNIARTNSHWETIGEKVVYAGQPYEHKVPDQKLVEDPMTNHTVEILIDVEDIVRQLAIRATRNKSGSAKFLAGALIVR